MSIYDAATELLEAHENAEYVGNDELRCSLCAWEADGFTHPESGEWVAVRHDAYVLTGFAQKAWMDGYHYSGWECLDGNDERKPGPFDPYSWDGLQ